MAETAMKFGPEWLRALSHGSNNSSSVPFETPLPKYKLAQYRYGREEMLALFTKDLKIPDEMAEFDFLVAEKCQLPLALLPTTEDEQRIWARSVNSDVALRGSGKPVTGPGGNGITRGGRGGSVDRGRGRGGRGGYYQRGVTFDDNEDVPPGGFTRLRTLERSQSVNEKDQRWDDRDRRFERTFAGRSGVLEDNITNSNLSKQESIRQPNDNWRRNEKEDDGGWRTAGSRAGRNSWRTPNDRDRTRLDYDGKERQQNGPGKNVTHHPRQRSNSGHFWDSDGTGDNVPEWSVEEPAAVTDVVGTFDSSGAFMETKVADASGSSDDIYTSDDDDCVKKKGSPRDKPDRKSKIESPNSTRTRSDISSSKLSVEAKSTLSTNKEETLEKPYVQSSTKVSCVEKSNEPHRVPDVQRTAKSSSSARSDICSMVTEMPPRPQRPTDVPGPAEEDAFAHHKMATENMMAQWAEEDDQRVTSKSSNKTQNLIPSQHEEAQKWYYQDPQSDIQGPFTSTEMSDWFKAGYFTDTLLLRRGCDERFTRLGEFISSLGGRMPFQPGNHPPPIRTIPAPVPISQAAPTPVPPPQPAPQMVQSDNQLHLMQQQMFQQLLQQQQQMLLRQAQYQQLLKQQESFGKLNPLQQNQAINQTLAQQQLTMPPSANLPDKASLESMPAVPYPLMGLTVPPVLKGDMPMWNVAPTPANWPMGQPTAQPVPGNIWDSEVSMSLPIEVSELEKKLAAEEDEKRLAMEAVKKLEEERKRREEEEQRKKEETERLLKEIQLQQEEEKRRREEERREEEMRRQEERLREEERRREEELRRLEEKRREEEELRKREELRKIEEERLLAEQMEEQAQKEKQMKKERKKLEELRKQEEQLKKQKEQERLRELKLKEEEAQRLRKLQAEELKAQKEAERQREVERKQRELLQIREIELQQKKEGPAWAVTNHDLSSEEMSLTDIQKLQEKKDREEKENLKLLQIQQQKILMQQQSQNQANKNGLSWAKRSAESSSTVKSLMQIQQEEAQRVTQQQQHQKAQKTAATAVQVTATTGVWGNSSQLNHATLSQAWNSNNSGFWDEPVKNTPSVVQIPKPAKNCESAFPALSNASKSASTISNKNRNVRAKKDEETVLKIFDAQKKPTDEFTTWCIEAVSNFNSSVDVPTFVAFLKDVESPYEVHDYVKSYLGEGKEVKEFGRQFLERRSKFRNKAKQAMVEENMWGPAPAITPTVKSSLVNDADAMTCTKSKARKKKNKMHKLDNSMLGFTVQPNPDRINVGEIDRVDGM